MLFYEIDMRHISGDGRAYLNWIIRRLQEDQVLVPHLQVTDPAPVETMWKCGKYGTIEKAPMYSCDSVDC